jgi:hypothetical protein
LGGGGVGTVGKNAVSDRVHQVGESSIRDVEDSLPKTSAISATSKPF